MSTTYDPATGAANDSLAGDYLWSSGNLGEAVPDVMTPATWSLLQRYLAVVMASSTTTPYPPIGNLGGRFYMNLSTVATIANAATLGLANPRKLLEQAFGRLPAGMQIPLLPLDVPAWLKTFARVMGAAAARQRGYLPRTAALLAASPGRFEAIRAKLQACPDAPGLLVLWAAEVEPYMADACGIQEAGRTAMGLAMLAPQALRWLAGEADAALLLGGGREMASLGPVVGLGQVARGELAREDFVRRWGHRGPHELELSIPRPAEDPAWPGPPAGDEDALLARQEAQRREARERHPLWSWLFAESAAQTARDREAIRSEVVRAFWAVRCFYLRAGELLALGHGVFFLTLDELLEALGGDLAPLDRIPAREAMHARYQALPVYPTLIRGAFDPFAWAADPHRRHDVFDGAGEAGEAAPGVTGFPGAAGVVEGRVRVLMRMEDGACLEPGEVLVTVATNVGWTPLFPRAAAVVTDVGAPLSHAAIVARELGIPAVVGCGNATMRLKTGDRVRVDGAAGTVERLD